MALNRIFKNKDYWQEDAFNRIKSDLLSVKDNRFVQYSHTAATHLVCVYGKSQVGKTTLILNMIGIKDDEYKKDVAEVLRGGIALGNSSTSTAIIYSQSDSDLYGIRIETLVGEKRTANVEYFTSDEMRQKLKSIRDDVEKNVFSNEKILHIFIPKSYFSSSESENKISILDLPGIESRNIQEKAHVESLMTRYVPLSSVCIITCTANEIQSLEKLELPNNIDWKNLHHKYFVVITRSYCAGNIKSYFDKPHKEREPKLFLDFLRDEFKKELSKILGKDYKTKIFLLDLGDSIVSLCNELKCEDDRKEVIKTRDSFLSSLRESILSSKGNNLLSCIKELEVIVNKIEDNKIQRLKDNKKEKEDKLKRLGEEIEVLNTNCNNYRSESQIIEDNIKIDKRLEEDLLMAATSFAFSLITRVKKEIEEKSLFKNKHSIRYFYDKDKNCMKAIQNHLMNHLDETVGSKVRSLMEDSDLNIDFYPSSIANSIYFKFVSEYESKLYPPSSLFKKLLGKSSKIDIQSAFDYIQQIDTIIQSEIRFSVISKCEAIIGKKQEKSKSCKDLLNKGEKKIKSKNADIEHIKNEIDANNEELAAVEYQKMHDEQTLKGFLKHAEEAYTSQRDKIYMEINSNNTSPTDKFFYVILLGIIDKDYKNISNASNE